MRKARPVFNVQLTVEAPALKWLPYVGTFTVMSDGLLVRGATKGLATCVGTVDTESGHPLDVDFQNREIGYLSRRGSSKSYYLQRNAIQVTKEVVENTARLARRYRT